MRVSDRVAYWLILLFSVTIISVKILGPLIYAVLALIGIYWILKKKDIFYSVKSIRSFSYITLGYFLVMVLSLVYSTEPTSSWAHLSRKAQFLVAPLVIYAVYIANVPLNNLLKSIKIGTMLAGVIVLIEYFCMDGGTRFSGMFNPNSFGDMVTIMTLFAICNIANEDKHEYTASLAAVALGTIAIVLSASRGSILSFILLMFIYLFLMVKYSHIQNIRLFAVMLVSILAFFSAAILTGSIDSRIKTAISQTENWQNGTDSTSSVGARWEMYKSGIDAFLDSPIIGYGYRNANIVASRYASKEAQDKIAGYTHLHNEVLTNMVSAGLLGVIALFAVFLVPFRMAINNLTIADKQTVSLMGIFLLTGYALLGMTHGMLEWEYENSFFLLFLSYIVVKLMQKKEA